MEINPPGEAEIQTRIAEHLAADPNNPVVLAVWQGYLAALIEWGLVSIDAHARLTALLGGAGADEVSAVLIGHETA